MYSTWPRHCGAHLPPLGHRYTTGALATLVGAVGARGYTIMPRQLSASVVHYSLKASFQIRERCLAAFHPALIAERSPGTHYCSRLLNRVLEIWQAWVLTRAWALSLLCSGRPIRANTGVRHGLCQLYDPTCFLGMWSGPENCKLEKP